ncbi:hypothetical protein SARC_12991 [Sphaeroforma arctica JP610]|uniref:Elongation factor EFG domain-containing protein n=1 Tax=Sphaeroforma arctica JP610 TaxID=667725 RepID=A0A0L0FCJ4_9EUKA|nr:hypothetical protein SARC_12991 [Sphaeroforma arctica JP610]KNC74464.1 hypothetical protein SARC_12991 [Sphaeroforma arctica JP610]|eukprot:XP_014148366.1 hypothetical protein SARC_12991 [Sphaeroforma arctica JP610]
MEIGEGDEGEGVYVNVSPDGSVRVRVRALPLPPQVGAVIDEYSDKLRRLGAGAVDDLGHESSSGSEWRQRLYDRLQRAFLSASQGKQRATTQQDTPNTDTEETNESGWEAFQVDEPIRQVYAMCARNLWAFGPKNCGPNVLVNGIPWYSRDGSAAGGEDEELEVKRGIVAKLDSSIVNGFQNATANGPLCEEPMRCVLFVVENIWMSPALLDRARTGEKPKGRGEGADNDFTPMHCTGELSDALESTASDNGANLDPKTLSKGSSLGAVIGQMVSVVKETCRKAFIASHPRLMYAQYACDIQAPAEVLGKVYAVVSKREGVVLSENMKEGSDIFTIKCLLPVRNSFGFADEIRKRTSGAAFPQLVFSHWETIPVNPFWIPTTVEELLHYGEIADTVNLAMKLMNDVRKRKGLRVKEKLVEHGEKQRTLGRNK